ncbi:MAG: hypothetical protein RSG56_01900, partial [Brevundimonas sp.]
GAGGAVERRRETASIVWVVMAGGGPAERRSAAGWTSRRSNDRAMYVGVKAHSHRHLPPIKGMSCDDIAVRKRRGISRICRLMRRKTKRCGQEKGAHPEGRAP